MNTIPLRQLPHRAFLCVLQTMEIYDQLAYSFCSKKTKKSIKSLNLKAQQIDLNVNDSVQVVISFQNLLIYWSSTKLNDVFSSTQLMIHEGINFDSIESEETRTYWTWDYENLDFKVWFHHFFEVLHHLRIDYFPFYGENLDDNCIEPIQKVIGGLQIGCLDISDELTNDFAKKVLESFPNYEEPGLLQIPFGRDKLNKLLIRNLKSICIPEAERLNIDQVLLSNSESLQLYISKFTERDLNTFLKLWIRGSNPRLQYFYTGRQPLLENGSFDKNIILKGVKYVQIPLGSQEVFLHRWRMFHKKIKLAGGFRVRKFDGTTAVIVVTIVVTVTESNFDFIVG